MDELNKLFNRVFEQVKKEREGEITEEEKETFSKGLVFAMENTGIDISTLMMYLHDIDDILKAVQEGGNDANLSIICNDSCEDKVKFEGSNGGLLLSWMILTDTLARQTSGMLNKELMLALLLSTNVGDGNSFNVKHKEN